MTRDTKIGLLVGLAFIILFGIILSEKGSSKQPLDTPQFAAYKPMVEVLPAQQTANVEPKPNFALPQLRQRSSGTQGARPGNSAGPIAQQRPSRNQGPPEAPSPTATNTANVPQRESQVIKPPAAQPSREPQQPSESLRKLLGPPQSSGLAQLGNQPTDTASPSAQSNAGSNMQYTVQEGDTLIAICRRFYGSGSPKLVRAIMQLNQPKLPRPEQLRAGQVITIPQAAQGLFVAVDDHPAAAITRNFTSRRTRPIVKTIKLAKAPPPQAVRWYTVQADDTLTKIATRMLGNPQAWKQVFELNHDTISNPHMVRAGAKIRIPASSTMVVSQGTSP